MLRGAATVPKCDIHLRFTKILSPIDSDLWDLISLCSGGFKSQRFRYRKGLRFVRSNLSVRRRLQSEKDSLASFLSIPRPNSWEMLFIMCHTSAGWLEKTIVSSRDRHMIYIFIYFGCQFIHTRILRESNSKSLFRQLWCRTIAPTTWIDSTWYGLDRLKFDKVT